MHETAVESHPFRKVREKGWGTPQVTGDPANDSRHSSVILVDHRRAK
jgi:hypothetical protein